MICDKCIKNDVCKEYHIYLHVASDGYIEDAYYGTDYKRFFEELNGCDKFKDKDLTLDIPCKIGDKLWVILNRFRGGNKLVVEAKCAGVKVRINFEHKTVVIFATYMHYKEENTTTLEVSDFGKTVFYTREQALSQEESEGE